MKKSLFIFICSMLFCCVGFSKSLDSLKQTHHSLYFSLNPVLGNHYRGYYSYEFPNHKFNIDLHFGYRPGIYVDLVSAGVTWFSWPSANNSIQLVDFYKGESYLFGIGAYRCLNAKQRDNFIGISMGVLGDYRSMYGIRNYEGEGFTDKWKITRQSAFLSTKARLNPFKRISFETRFDLGVKQVSKTQIWSTQFANRSNTNKSNSVAINISFSIGINLF